MRINFAISLHAPTTELRTSLCQQPRVQPRQVDGRGPVYTEKSGRRITFEYGLFGGVNDTEEHAQQLADLLKEFKCHVNLIPVNTC